MVLIAVELQLNKFKRRIKREFQK